MFDSDLFEDQLAAQPLAPNQRPKIRPESDFEVYFMRRMLLLYTLLAVYGTLFPGPSLIWPQSPINSIFTDSLFAPLAATDVVFNLLIYIPFGLLMMRALGSMKFDNIQLATVALAGMALSLSLEAMQAFVPGRSPSFIDVFTNTLGALAGAALSTIGVFAGEWGRRVLIWRRRYLAKGPIATLGAVAVGLWVVCQLSPFVPSPSVSNIRHGLSPLWQWATGNTPFSILQWIQYSAALFAIAVAAKQALKAGRDARPIYLFLGVVLLLKVPIMECQLSPEAVLGWLTGCTLALAATHRRRAITLAGVAALLCAATERMRHGMNDQLHSMDWIPFKGQMTSLSGIADVASAAWPYTLLLFLLFCRRNLDHRVQNRRRRPPWSASTLLKVGTPLVGSYALLLELIQTAVPGRYPDITDPLVAAAAWALPLLHPAIKAIATPAAANPTQPKVMHHTASSHS